MAISLSSLVSLCLVWAGVGLALSGPEVTIEQGALLGSYLESASGRTFAAFQGIPYAKPAIGKNRFEEPEPAEPWSGVWNAQSPGSPCLQFDGLQVLGDEDCLFLNVYTPTPTPERKLAVVVNVHGGAFMVETATDNGPKYLLDRDIVLVTLNYRLGPFGFFSTGDHVVPGNDGLKDQTLALTWVRDNVAAFGGDPSRVTLVGTSAGAASVHLHYLSPGSRGLFQQGISLSGTALLSCSSVKEVTRNGREMGRLLGCPTTPSPALVDCLRQRPARAIARQLAHFTVWRLLPYCPWGPVVEVPGPTAFLAESPVDVLLEGRALDVPWITGVNSHEGLFPTADFVTSEVLTQEFAARWDELAPLLLCYHLTTTPDQRDAVSRRVKQFYLGDEPISVANRDKLIQMAGDGLFASDAERAAKLQAKTNSAPVYFYEFAYRGEDSVSNLLSQTTIHMGSSHGDDSAYVFDAYYCSTNETEQDRAMSALMVDWWVRFVETGNPSPPGVDWPSLTAGSEQLDYLRLAGPTDVKVLSDDDFGNRKFWQSLPLREALANRAVDEL